MAQINSHLATAPPFPGPVVDFNFFKKAATAIVYQELVAGVLNTIAIQGNNGLVIAFQATALGTNQIIVNAAIVYVNALGGGSVYVEQGDYPLTASVALLQLVYLYGAGPDTVLDGGAAAHALDINGVTNAEVARISFSTTQGGGTAFNPINIHGGSSYIRFENIHIFSSDNDGIAITNADSEIWVLDSVIVNCDNYGLNCDGDDCVFREVDYSGVIGNDAIFLGANSDDCYVISNHIHAWTGEPIDDDGDNIVKRNLCVVVGANVVAWNSKGCGFATIQACIDHQAGDGMIRIEEGTYTVAAGVISLDAADNNLKIVGAGILVTILSSSTGTCLDINACVNVQIMDLSVETTGVGANDAIVVRGASIAIFLAHIACTDAGQDALSIAAASSNVHAEHLYLFGVGAAGIARYGINNLGDDCIFESNRIANTGDDGIWLQAGGTYCIVVGNRISGWVNEGIDWDEPTCDVNHNITAV